MALFGKKKGDAPINNQESATPKTENGAFDFDSIARDLEAENGPSAFDDLLSKPANVDPFDVSQNSLPEEIGGSAFDFPESFDEEDESTSGRTVISSSSNDLDDFDDIFGGSSASNAVPSSDSFPDLPLNNTPSTPAATPSTATVVSEQPAPKAKKPFPLIPALAAVAVLVIGGGAAVFFSSQTPEEEPVPIVSTVPAPPKKPEPADSVKPDAPKPAVKPPVEKAPVAPPVENEPAPTPPAKPAPPAPSATIDDPELAARLKNLWEQGKDAKKRGDYASARQFWQQALILKPNHPGFQESIDKLPK